MGKLKRFLLFLLIVSVLIFGLGDVQVAVAEIGEDSAEENIQMSTELNNIKELELIDLQKELQKEPQIVKEVEDKRTEFSKQYLVSDNTYQIEYSMIPVHYEDTNGKFHEISNNIIDRCQVCS
ncbi:hypothetical protein D3C74_249980 [compost metagenome]